MSNRNDDSWIPWAIGAVIALVALVIWKFSEFFGLDMATGTTVFFRLVVLAILAGLMSWIGEHAGPFGLKNTWPMLIALCWMCWWPALDFYAAKQLPSSTWSYEKATEVIWWSEWYTKWGGFVIINALGYYLNAIFKDD